MRRQIAYDFSNLVALVTGAVQEIGLATAEAFDQAAVTVVLSEVNLQALQPIVDPFAHPDNKVIAIECDASDPLVVNLSIGSVVKTFGRLDIAYNNSEVNQVAIEAAG